MGSPGRGTATVAAEEWERVRDLAGVRALERTMRERRRNITFLKRPVTTCRCVSPFGPRAVLACSRVAGVGGHGLD